MVKNIILYIFIYVLCISCGDSIVTNDCNCYLDISAPSLQIDENGYYHMEWLEEYVQTFSTLEARTGVDYQKVGWISNREMNVKYFNTTNWTNLVNTSSYTNNEGITYTVLGVWEEFVSDTIKVYCGYTDECNIEHKDSLEVIIDE